MSLRSDVKKLLSLLKVNKRVQFIYDIKDIDESIPSDEIIWVLFKVEKNEVEKQ